MAWRIHDQVVRVIMDNRIPGRVTGSVWLIGKNDPLQLDLVGNPWRDMAGCLLTLEHPQAVPDPLGGLATEQRGVCGDLTVSRKVKIPTVPLEEWLQSHPNQPFPHAWDNGVYLEWFSERNGRVVIELSGIQMQLSEPTWHMTPQEEQEQRHHNAQAMHHFMHRLVAARPFALCHTPGSQPQPEWHQTHADLKADLQGDADADPDRELEQRIRIETLKEQVRDRTGGQMICGGDGNVPLDVLEQFWQNVLEFEDEPYPERKIRELLAEDGFHPQSPDEWLDDDAIEVHLERLVDALARRGLLLCQTEHLSNRELYTVLLQRVLEEETEAYPVDSGWFTHLEISRYGAPDGESGTQVYLRYYADPSERKRWHREFPQDPLPPHQDPPYQRDLWMP